MVSASVGSNHRGARRGGGIFWPVGQKFCPEGGLMKTYAPVSLRIPLKGLATGSERYWSRYSEWWSFCERHFWQRTERGLQYHRLLDSSNAAYPPELQECDGAKVRWGEGPQTALGRPVAGKSPWGGRAPQIPPKSPLFVRVPPYLHTKIFSMGGAMAPLAPLSDGAWCLGRCPEVLGVSPWKGGLAKNFTEESTLLDSVLHPSSSFAH